MIVGRDEWRGNVRHVHEIAELRDVAVVTNPAYAAAAVEYRAAPQPDQPTPETHRRSPPCTPRTTQRAASASRTAPPSSPAPRRDPRPRRACARSQGRGRVAEHDHGRPDRARRSRRTFLWDQLRARRASCSPSGVRVIPTDRESITWPRLTADVDPDWYAEEEMIAAGDPTFGDAQRRRRTSSRTASS